MSEEQLRVIAAAIAYCEGTNPDGHPLDLELREAVGELTKSDER